MSISVVFYTFSKRINSTKKPTGAGTSFSCLLREPTSMENPTIVLQTSNPTAYNYAYISDFGGRYYFVNDWTSHKGQWIAHLKVDPLATFSATIKASTQYVTRSASAKDEYISDSLYPATVACDYALGTTTGTNPFDTSNISFIVGIIGDASPLGSVTYYCFNSTQMTLLLDYMATTYNLWSSIDPNDIAEGLQKALINPFQYIVSCHALPVPQMGVAHLDLSTFPIKFGPYEYIESYAVIGTVYTLNPNTTYSRSLSYTIPKHPKAATIGKYLNATPYSEYTAFVGPFGSIPIDPQYLVDESSLTYKVDFDLISGDAILHIYNSEGIGGAVVKSAHVGVTIPMSALQNNMMAQVMAPAEIISSAGKMISNQWEGITGVWTGITDYLKGAFPQVEVKGSQGSFVGWAEPVRLAAKFYDIVAVDNFHYGSPLMQMKTLSSLTGFTICGDPEIAISGTEEENNRIIEFMKQGFFLE